MLRFNNLSLPTGATVTGATLSLVFDNWATGFTVRGYYVKNAWAVNTSLGWINRDAGVPWATPGARGMGSDIASSPTFAVSDLQGTGVEPRTITLDTATVQGWINTPSSNQGVLFWNEGVNDVTRIYSSDDATVAN